jgi:hypothetical protein
MSSRQLKNAHLRRTAMYASFLGISDALHLNIFHQPAKKGLFEEQTITA